MVLSRNKYTYSKHVVFVDHFCSTILKLKTVDQIFEVLNLIEVSLQVQMDADFIPKIRAKAIEVLQQWSKEVADWNKM